MIGGCWNVLRKPREGKIMIIIRGNAVGLGLYSTSEFLGNRLEIFGIGVAFSVGCLSIDIAWMELLFWTAQTYL
jgi:hypothetical protein